MTIIRTSRVQNAIASDGDMKSGITLLIHLFYAF